MLEIINIKKQFGLNLAVKNVNLTIGKGEFFSLLGPSGCGKTTLLRMLAGFESPTEGKILLDGQRIDTLPANQRQFNMVFQKYALFPHLNVRENIAFGLKVKNVPATELKKRAEEALALVQLESFANRNVTTLSGGQQQRVALARALINRPKVLLLDEPLSALDLKLRQQMQVELLNLQRSLKITFIFVTHDQDEALTLSDRIAVMNHGVVEQVGTAQEIYESPKTPFVAEFIGSINCFQGSVLEATSDKVVVGGAFKKSITIKPSQDGLRLLPQMAVQQSVKVLVRPEKMRVLKTAPGNDQNCIEGHIKEILFKGSVTHLLVQPKDENQSPVFVSQTNVATNVKKTQSIKDSVFIAWSPEDSFLL